MSVLEYLTDVFAPKFTPPIYVGASRRQVLDLASIQCMK
jgi:hypothetical protein